MERRAELVIQQVLHGYANGHTLLASSCDLSSAEKRTLLIMSDLSGANQDKNFSSYLTGYPLPGNRYYALGRTWYAPEMRRPGCVWTQTLLINLPLLGRIKQLEILDSLFIRPSVNLQEFYNNPVSIDGLVTPSIDKATKDNNRSLDDSLLTISRYLYEMPKKSIVIPAESSFLYEKSMFSIWSLQWPRLRRRFSFCTGALSLRRLDDKLLDCQVVPKTLLGTIARREIPTDNIVDFETPLDNSSWINVLSKAKPSELSSFMHRYGSDMTGGREKFKPLCLAFYMNNEAGVASNTLEEYVRFFNHFFTLPGEAKRLKKFLLLKKIEQVGEDDYSTLLTLLNTSSSVLADIDWKATDKLVDLWQKNILSPIQLHDLIQAVNAEQLTPDDKLFLTINLPVESWLSANWLSEDILTQLLSVQPHLAENYKVWHSAPTSVQRMWFEAAERTNAVEWGEVLKTMIDANNSTWLEQGFEHISPQTSVNLIGELISKGYPLIKEKPKLLINILDTYLHYLESQPSPSSHTLRFVCEILLNNTVNANKLPNNIIFSVSKFISNNIQIPGRIQLMAILLAPSFNNKFSNSQDIITLLFEQFHIAGQRNFIDQTSWQLIISDRIQDEEKRPSGLFFWFFDQYKPGVPAWDKCGKLRQILVESFILFKWNELGVVKAIHDINVFKQIVDYCLTFDSGVAFLARIYKALQTQRDNQKTFHFTIVLNALEYRMRSKKKK